MKKLLILIAITELICAPAKAQEQTASSFNEISPFVGLELTKNDLSMTDGLDQIAKDSYSSFSVSVGTEFKTNLPVSLSLFYQKSGEEDKTTNVSGYPYKTTGEFDAFGIDAAVHFPLADKFELFGGVGFGRYEFDMSDNIGFMNGTEKHTGIRYAAGLEYKLTHRLSFDAFMRYVDFDYDSAEDFVEDLTEIGIGLKISF